MLGLIEDILEIPEIFEEVVYKMPLWYYAFQTSYVIFALMFIFMTYLYIREGHRKYLLYAFEFKWAEHAFASITHLTYVACLSEDNFIKYVRGNKGPYMHSDIEDGAYQMAAFFAIFAFSLFDLAVCSYILYMGHVFV